VRDLPIDTDYLLKTLVRLLRTPSPTGYTDRVVRIVCDELERLGIPFELTRRGAIRADLGGEVASPDRAIVAHVDTLGAMVRQLKPNGRLALVPIGTWSARFAEGARVTVFTDTALHRGTILPLKASGHAYGDEVDGQPVSWDNLELRVDAPVAGAGDLARMGFNIGDIVAIDTGLEIAGNGYINARHLDDKAGVAAVLAAAKAIVDAGPVLPVDCHLLFTISEEVGSGASGVLHGDVAEMVTVDNGVVAPNQASGERTVTMAMADMCGPFDYHLTRRLIELCGELGLSHRRDVFRHYRSDSASAVEAGNDIRTALVTFGVDSSHGYERTHLDALVSVARLLAAYAQSRPLFLRDRRALAPLEGFSDQETEPEPAAGE
jgi:peptidase M42 family hydrolase